MKHLLLTMTSTVRIIGAGVAAMTPAAAGRPFAIVTGGTRGIGSGIATVLSEEGYDLLLTYNSDKEAADEFVSSLSSKDEDLRAECVAGDISLCETRDEIFAVVDAMRSDGGRLEVVVHNAGQVSLFDVACLLHTAQTPLVLWLANRLFSTSGSRRPTRRASRPARSRSGTVASSARTAGPTWK